MDTSLIIQLVHLRMWVSLTLVESGQSHSEMDFHPKKESCSPVSPILVRNWLIILGFYYFWVELPFIDGCLKPTECWLTRWKGKTIDNWEDITALLSKRFRPSLHSKAFCSQTFHCFQQEGSNRIQTFSRRWWPFVHTDQGGGLLS